MAMVVKNNMSAVRTLNTLNSNTSALQKSLQKVSSGMKINSAQDDASGYAISERMRVRIRSLDQANQNTQNDSSLMKTAEGAVGNTVEILRSLKEKAINAANDSNTEEDRRTIQKEIDQFIDQIDDNALVQFNGKYLVDGSKNNASNASKTILLNQSLHTSTLESTLLTDLKNRAGDSLSIQTTDKWQVSWVENGNINFTSGTVGTNSLQDILNTAWTDDATGNAFGEVKATTPTGRISTAATEPTYTTLGTVATGAVVSADMLNVITHYDGYTEGTGAAADAQTFEFAELGFYADSEGGTVFTYTDSSGDEATVDASALTITYDGSANPTTANFTVSTLTDGTEIFGTPYVDTGTFATETTLTPTDETIANSGTQGDYTNTLNQELIASGGLDVTAAEGNVTATMKLSELTTTDTDGNTIPKYYLDADGASAEDIVVTRTVNFVSAGGNLTFNGENIAFSSASGGTLPTKLYAYNPNYVAPSTEGTGFDDAPDKFGKAVYTPDLSPGIAVAASEAGVDKQISGLTISILDQDGNVKKAANAALDQFKQYQRAENETGDMSLNFHIGSEANVAIKVGMGDMRSQALGLKGSDGTRINVYNKENANAAINVIENALTKALDQQTTIGAIEARLEYTSTNLTTSSENVQAAESTIRDADMAKEMTNYTKSNVLLQAAQAMLAQANQNSSAVLSLLQ